MLSKFYKSDGKSTESLTARQQFAKQRVENYISIGRYKFEETECVCGSKKDYIVLSEKDRYGLAHRVVLCKNCLTIYATPRYDRITFEDFYKNIYRDLYESDDRSISDFFHHQYEQGLQIHNFILNNSELPSSANIFEAGCGAGGILALCRIVWVKLIIEV